MDFLSEGALDRAPFGNFGQAQALFRVEWAKKHDVFGDLVEKAVAGFAIGAVLGVDALVLERHFDALQRPAFALRIEPHGHRGARAKGREQELIRVRPSIRATRGNRLVREEAMVADLDAL